jgi:hypothetical protein
VRGVGISVDINLEQQGRWTWDPRGEQNEQKTTEMPGEWASSSQVSGQIPPKAMPRTRVQEFIWEVLEGSRNTEQDKEGLVTAVSNWGSVLGEPQNIMQIR